MSKRLFLLMVLVLLIAVPHFASAQSWERLSADQKTKALNQMTPEQQQVVQQTLSNSSGTLTPEALETIRQSPSFQGVQVEDIVKGKELLDRKNGETPLPGENQAWENGSQPSETDAIDGFEKIPAYEPQQTLFDRARQTGRYQNIPLDLKPFGHDFFREAAVRLITERKDMPVSSQYVIGPGDEVKILLWGRINAQYDLTVDRNGHITIPQIGPLAVAGMTYDQMSAHVTKQATQIVGANVDIAMGSLKSIPVFVLGDVKRPGAYTIGSFATITDALLIAGGPSEIGSLRNVQLKRKNQLIVSFDLYKLLLSGDKSDDRVLQAGDVVFVPVSGPLVGIAGNVKRPAIYELKDKRELQYVIDLAGGIIPTADTQQIQIERIVKNEKQIVVDIDDKHLSRAHTVGLQDADLVKIFSIVDADVNAVFLQGHVKKPGKYELKPGMRLGDVIQTVDALLPEPYLKYALVKRSHPLFEEPKLMPFHLGKMLDGSDPAANLVLMPKDEITVFSAWFFKDKPSFSVAGEVRMPARYDLIGNYRVKDALLAAGGLTRYAYTEKGQILRVDDNRQYRLIHFNVADALKEVEADNILLHDEDVITVRALSEVFHDQTVSVDGAVSKPGSYRFAGQMTVKDLIFVAGNVLEAAYLENAEISSMVVEQDQAARIETRNINLRKALAGDPAHNIALNPYDRIFVRQISDWRREHYVQVTGQVRFPGRYIVRKNEKISSLIARAGGYADDAYLRGAVFTRERVRQDQARSLQEIANRLERDLLIEGAGDISTSMSLEEVQAKKVEVEHKKALVEKMKSVQAKGRMTIRLSHLRLLKGSEFDIELEDGDALFIPERSSVVSVMGAVMGQGSYVFSERADYLDYVNMSGGFSDYADARNVFILKVDGSARKAYRGLIKWNDKNERLEMSSFSDIEEHYIEPGDIIVVPEKFGRIAWLREVRDITQILMNTAVVAGVVIKLF
ncbi:MAG: SLBB domain-containing protein [Smithellaceae bacterium]